MNGKEQGSRIRDFKNNCIKAVCFLMIGILLFSAVQKVFMPKRAPYTKSYDAGKLAGFYNEKNDSIDVLICSTSHTSKSILPMELYEKYGIKSYNLSTSIQPIEATYYMLSEALKTQSPKLFIFDVSNLYFSSVEAAYWWFVLDEMQLGKNKLELTREYKRSANGSDESTRELLLPLLRYHARWKELREVDFTGILSDKPYYGKGGQINSSVSAAGISVEEMNAVAEELLQSTEKINYVYDSEGVQEERKEHNLLNIDIPEKNIEWLEKIKSLCDENDIQLLAVKVPTVYLPQSYRSAWVEEKYLNSRALCEEYGITYYDFMYDTDVDIDWSKDTCDEGLHLNLRGAQKVSADLGEYLKEHYELPNEYNEAWDKELLSYQQVRKVAQLELERDFLAYINMLANEYKDKLILMSAAEDMSAGLSEEDISALRALGLRVDFPAAINKSYIAVIENGEVKYEALSNRQLGYQGVCDKSGTDYEIYSSGWYTGADTSIKVADKEYAYNHEGLNIVVYDIERDLVIDSVCFETNVENHTANRSNSKTNGLEEAFEKYMMETEYR